MVALQYGFDVPWKHRLATRLAPTLRRLRPLPGARHLSDWAQRHFGPSFAGDDRWAWVDDFDGRLRLRVDRTQHIGATIYWHGGHSLNELALLRRLVRPGVVFVDGGAHLGHFSLVAAARGARVLSIEPVDSVRAQLIANVEANGLTNVQVSDLALSDRGGKVALFANPNRLHDPVATGVAAFGRTHLLQEATATTLDALVRESRLSRVDVIKLDLEGAELPALRGARGLLQAHHPELILELSHPLFSAAGYTQADLLDYLGALGYQVGLITEYPLSGALHRLELRRYGRVVAVNRMALPEHCNVFAATPERFAAVVECSLRA
ncbi:MAG: FkbM family methyltransferase [Deltaproteobacteria bacterium]|nr:FkbM family methyltransferase [Deltaproteobacteria bacterium]